MFSYQTRQDVNGRTFGADAFHVLSGQCVYSLYGCLTVPEARDRVAAWCKRHAKDRRLDLECTLGAWYRRRDLYYTVEVDQGMQGHCVGVYDNGHVVGFFTADQVARGMAGDSGVALIREMRSRITWTYDGESRSEIVHACGYVQMINRLSCTIGVSNIQTEHL